MDQEIRILYAIAESYPTHRADIIALFGKYLPRHGIKSDIVTSADPAHQGGVEWAGGDTILGQASGGAAKLRLQHFSHIIKQLLGFDAQRYQAVQIRDMPVVAALAVIISWFRGFKVFYWMSYPMAEGQIAYAKERGVSSGLMKFLYPWISGHVGKFLLYRFVLRQVLHIFVQSNVMKQEMMDRGYPSEKLTPVPMGVDLEVVEQYVPTVVAREQLAGKKVLVYLGILERARKIEVLLDMLVLVLQRFPDAVLVLAGDTPDVDHRNSLLALAKSKNIDHALLWTGWLPTEVAWSYVSQADVALSPYPRGHLLDSASPTKVAEYMALSKVTVANDQPDQAEILAASGAGVAVEYTAENFAREVVKLLEDDELRNSMGIKGKQWVAENRSYASLTPTLASIYVQLSR